MQDMTTKAKVTPKAEAKATAKAKPKAKAQAKAKATTAQLTTDNPVVETGSAEATKAEIRKINTRFPNFEVGFLAALLTFPSIRKNLGIITGFIWEFVYSSIPVDEVIRKIKEIQGERWFNTGGGKWDQHNDDDDNARCSLDLIRDFYDFLKRRKWLWQIYRRVQQNDVKGARVTKGNNHLRAWMQALTPDFNELRQHCKTEEEFKQVFQREAVQMLDFLRLGFQAMFTRAQEYQKQLDANEIESIPIDALFKKEEILKGIEKVDPGKLEWFKEMMAKARKNRGKAAGAADGARKKAEEEGKAATVIHPDLPIKLADDEHSEVGQLRVIMMYTSSFLAGQFARIAKYDLAIIRRPSHNVQLFCRDFWQMDDGMIIPETDGLIDQAVLDSGDNQAIEQATDDSLDNEKALKGRRIAVWRLDLGAIASILRFLEAKYNGQRLVQNYISELVWQLREELDEMAVLFKKRTLNEFFDNWADKIGEIKAEIAAKRWEGETGWCFVGDDKGIGIDAAYAKLDGITRGQWWNKEVNRAFKDLREALSDLGHHCNKIEWEKTGHVYYQNGDQCPWYLAEFWCMLARRHPDVYRYSHQDQPRQDPRICREEPAATAACSARTWMKTTKSVTSSTSAISTPTTRSNMQPPSA